MPDPAKRAGGWRGFSGRAQGGGGTELGHATLAPKAQPRGGEEPAVAHPVGEWRRTGARGVPVPRLASEGER
jgi:hypothetical protein